MVYLLNLYLILPQEEWCWHGVRACAIQYQSENEKWEWTLHSGKQQKLTCFKLLHVLNEEPGACDKLICSLSSKVKKSLHPLRSFPATSWSRIQRLFDIAGKKWILTLRFCYCALWGCWSGCWGVCSALAACEEFTRGANSPFCWWPWGNGSRLKVAVYHQRSHGSLPVVCSGWEQPLYV